MATKAVEAHSKGSVFATKVVRTRKEKQCLRRDGSANTQGKGNGEAATAVQTHRANVSYQV